METLTGYSHLTAVKRLLDQFADETALYLQYLPGGDFHLIGTEREHVTVGMVRRALAEAGEERPMAEKKRTEELQNLEQVLQAFEAFGSEVILHITEASSGAENAEAILDAAAQFITVGRVRELLRRLKEFLVPHAIIEEQAEQGARNITRVLTEAGAFGPTVEEALPALKAAGKMGVAVGGGPPMNLKVLKYGLAMNKPEDVVMMPAGAVPLHVANQGEKLVLWALVNPDHRLREHTFHILQTGDWLRDGESLYVGTALFKAGAFVLHVYDAGDGLGGDGGGE